MFRFFTILLVLLVAGCFRPASSSSISVPSTTTSSKFASPYDSEIKTQAKRYLPSWHWHWYKAQLYQESKLDPNAVSPVGARGIAQFMPATWAEVSKGLGYDKAVSPLAAKAAIQAGAYYDAKLRAGWAKTRKDEDEIRPLTLASYNAGTGSILKAQKRCVVSEPEKTCRSWKDIQPFLAGVTGAKNAKETTGYITSIDKWFREMSK